MWKQSRHESPEIVSDVRHRGGSEFPTWCARIAAALVIHAGVGWVLGLGPLETPAGARSVVAQPHGLEDAIECQVAEREAVAGRAAESPAVSDGAALRAVSAPASQRARGTSPRSPASPRHSDPGRAPVRGAGLAGEPAAPPDVSRSAVAARMTTVPSASTLGVGRAASEAAPDRVASAGSRVATSSAGGGPTLASHGRGFAGRASGGGAGAAGGTGAGSLANSPAHLLGAGNRCADLFPYAATSDTGTVAVSLEVASSGQPSSSRVLDEAPRDQGFGVAASHCVRRLRFAPAVDGSGRPVTSRSVVRLRFERGGLRPRVAL